MAICGCLLGGGETVFLAWMQFIIGGYPSGLLPGVLVAHGLAMLGVPGRSLVSLHGFATLGACALGGAAVVR